MNYTQFYKDVRRYASNYACRLFRDEGARVDAVDRAMDSVVDRILGGEITPSLAKCIAHDSLINIFRATPVNKNKDLKGYNLEKSIARADIMNDIQKFVEDDMALNK